MAKQKVEEIKPKLAIPSLKIGSTLPIDKPAEEIPLQ